MGEEEGVHQNWKEIKMIIGLNMIKIYAFMKLSKENNSTVHLVDLNTVLSLASALADIRTLSRFSHHPTPPL